MAKTLPIIRKDLTETSLMRKFTDINHAAALKQAWCAPVMTAGNFVPASTCTKIRSRGTRTAPEPVDYCATQVEPTTWGSIKRTYR